MPSKTKILGHQWEISSLWNEALETIPERPLVKREHIWASEVGGPMVDRYLKMNAHPMTNPPNPRSKRKFSAGHIWEWILGVVLTSSGLLKQKQLVCEVQLKDMLRVSGKCDLVAGGVVDWDKAKYQLETLKKFFEVAIGDLPPIITHSITKIIDHMQKKYGNNPLEEVIVEAKSISSFMSEKLQKTGRAVDQHVLQILSYAIPNKLPGKLSYICKDDCIMQEFRVEPVPGLLKLYKQDIATITGYINGAGKNYLKHLPPVEPEIFFDAEMYRFSMNYKLEYSPYLEMLYGFKNPEAYRNKWGRRLTAWNRVIKRLATLTPTQNVTPSNKKYMAEMKQEFPEWEKYMLKAKKTGFFEKDEEEGEDE